jgi:hypothetical protein
MRNKHAIFLILPILLFSSCSKDDSDDNQPDLLNLSSENFVTDTEGNRYEVGFDQSSSVNQDAFVRKVDSEGQQVWKINHDSSPVDTRATLVALDRDENPWVVFTADGGSNESGYITRKELASPEAFQGVYQNSYGMGGGPKVSIIAQLDPISGKIIKGTFITARLSNGNTNTLNITAIGVNDNLVAFEIASAAWPPGPGTSYSRFPDLTDEDRTDGTFLIYYEMNKALSELLRAELK